jgi:hypothetical protein
MRRPVARATRLFLIQIKSSRVGPADKNQRRAMSIALSEREFQ